MKKNALIASAALFVSACLPTAQSPGVSHGTSPEVCANILARANASPDAAARAYALEQAAAIGC